MTSLAAPRGWAVIAVAVPGLLVGCGGAPAAAPAPATAPPTAPTTAAPTTTTPDATGPAGGESSTSTATGTAATATTEPDTAGATTDNGTTDDAAVSTIGPTVRCPDGGALIASATWFDVAEGPSLSVVPTQRMRQCGMAAPEDAGWDEVLALVPEADTPALRQQYHCHVRFAATKDSWNLEPWRAEVDEVTLILERCNPGGGDPDLGG